MRNAYPAILPSTFELWCIGLTSAGLLVAGNAKLFLEHYGLISSSVVFQQQLTQRVNSGVVTLDTFTITPTLVTFITWGVIGLVLFSAMQALLRASGLIKFERDLSSNRYVHPANFNRSRYWRTILVDAVLSFSFLAVLAVGAILYLLFIVPVSFAYTARLLLQFSPIHLLDLLLGMFTIFAGTAVLYSLLKLVIWHHRLSLH